jgi:hypothetical protein
LGYYRYFQTFRDVMRLTFPDEHLNGMLKRFDSLADHDIHPL